MIDEYESYVYLHMNTNMVNKCTKIQTNRKFPHVNCTQ